ncbi:MAG: hypothetical protein LJE66_07080 [Desulfobacterales bacterium]|nr:hypothetical protein [Desulfobacterales bacterium]
MKCKSRLRSVAVGLAVIFGIDGASFASIFATRSTASRICSRDSTPPPVGTADTASRKGNETVWMPEYFNRCCSLHPFEIRLIPF